MAFSLPGEVYAMLKDGEMVKVLSTVDSSGVPHSVVKNSLTVDDDGNILYLELIESSRTNSNMTGSIWFGRRVAILLAGKDGASYQIKGTPLKCLVAGPVFEAHYTRIREALGDVDLGAVWIIAPEEIADETFRVRFDEESAARPMFLHIDRIARDGSQGGA